MGLKIIHQPCSQASPMLCITHGKQKSGDKQERSRNTYGGREMDIGGVAVPIYKLVCNKRQSEFLTSEVEYSQSHEHLRSWLSLECSMMKSGALFQSGPFHFAFTRCHSFDWCSQAFPIFCRSSTFAVHVYYAEQTEEQKVCAWPGNNTRLFQHTYVL